MKNIQTLVQTLARIFRCFQLSARCSQLEARSPHPAINPSVQLTLDLDAPTPTGLPLREALPVRSAELWLQLGQPDRALAELQSLPESARQHPWTRRVNFDAAIARLHQAPA